MQQGDPYYFSDDFMNTSAPSALPRKRPLSLAQEVMNDLMGRIRTGHFKPGEKLPTEPEIMAEQGVSRTVVREALSRLQAAEPWLAMDQWPATTRSRRVSRPVSRPPR